MLLLETTACRLRRSIFCYVVHGRDQRTQRRVCLHAMEVRPTPETVPIIREGS